MKILLASDGFVTEKVLRSALAEAYPEAEVAALASTWPVPPFKDIGDVREASGDEDELIEALEGCEIAFSHTFPFTRRVIEASPELKMITICRGGPVNVNIDAATEHGVLVTYTPGRNATATAEHSLAMILAAARQIAQRHSEVASGQWRSDYYLYDRVGPEIAGSTIGLVGYGAIGSRVATALVALGATVLVYDPWAEDPKLAGITFHEDLNVVMSQANILSLHARVTDDNRHMINAKNIALMPENSIIVNCARGELLDYDAVCNALETGKLYAAAFDTFPEEPLPANHRLRTFSNVTMTPHLAGASKGAAELAARIGAADIAAFAQGGEPQYVANPEVLNGN